MNNTELEKLLQSAPLPERAPEYWEEFPKRVAEKLRQTKEQPKQPVHPERPQTRFRFAPVMWGLSLAAACLVLGFFLGFWKERDGNVTAQQLAQMQKYFREVEGLFPNQLQAIVFDGQEPRLVLAESPNVPRSTPIFVRVSQADKIRSYITFSGQEIRINGEVCEVLVDAQGHVILVGKKWLWSSSQPKAGREPYRIEARRLESVL